MLALSSLLLYAVRIGRQGVFGKSISMIATKELCLEEVMTPANIHIVCCIIQKKFPKLRHWDELKLHAKFGFYRAMQTYDPTRSSDPVSWAIRKAVYSVIDELRKEGILRRKETGPYRHRYSLVDKVEYVGEEYHIPDDGVIDESTDNTDVCAFLLDKLEPRHRQIVEMYFFEGMYFKEIGPLLDPPIKQSYTSILCAEAMEQLKVFRDEAGLPEPGEQRCL